MVYLVLYKTDWRSWVSILISLGTFSRYTHSVIQVGDRIFEASGSRRTVGWQDASIHKGRIKRATKLPISAAKAEAILNKYDGMKYDIKALKWWMFALQDDSKVYCFEVCWAFLYESDLLQLGAPKKMRRYTARKLLKRLTR